MKALLSIVSSLFFGAALASAAATQPPGLTCGLSYKNGPYATITAKCGEYKTTDYNRNSQGLPYAWFFDGDFGAPANHGYLHFATFPRAAQAVASHLWEVPQGTVCGFGHSRNSVGGIDEGNCLGIRVSHVRTCPTGWTYRQAYDDDGGGAYWFWCERDDNGSYNAGMRRQLLPGTACGLHYMGDTIAECDGERVYQDRCPAGFNLRKGFDQGAPAGRGLRWCEYGGQ